jgi:hypothetical protein
MNTDGNGLVLDHFVDRLRTAQVEVDRFRTTISKVCFLSRIIKNF